MPFLSPPPLGDLDHRRFPLGLGSPYQHRLCWGAMADQHAEQAHQLPQAPSYLLCFEVILLPPSRSHGSSPLQQRHCSSLLEQTGQHSVPVTLSSGTLPLILLHPSFDSSSCAARARKTEYDSRCPERGILIIPRNGDKLDLPQTGVLLLGHSGCRCVRHSL